MSLFDAAAAFGLVFLAELGDKSQVTVAVLSSRGRPWPVVLGTLAAFLLLTVLACTLGAALASLVPYRWLRIAAGLVFLLMAGLALRRPADEGASSPRASFGGAFAAISLAELGDKTQIATATMAASRDAFSVGAGAFLALGLSTVLAAFVGSALLARLPARVLRWGTVAVFALAGVLLLGQAFI